MDSPSHSWRTNRGRVPDDFLAVRAPRSRLFERQLIWSCRGISYIIDVYSAESNSALAANTLVRSTAGAGFPLFATAMYHTLGVPWATSLLGFLTLAFIPVPFVFFVYGERIRKLSKYVPTA